jgi:cytochrome c biogenesis protein CcdA
MTRMPTPNETTGKRSNDLDEDRHLDLRSKICIWVIVLGMLNFLVYTVSYSLLWGEAVNGTVELDESTQQVVYKLQSGKQVTKGQFIYSGVHSILIWPTVMAVMLAMLTLAKDRIADSMREAVVRGRTLCTVLAVVIAISTSGMMFLFIRQFSAHMDKATMLRKQHERQDPSDSVDAQGSRPVGAAESNRP